MVTLFYLPSDHASIRAHTILKQAAATSQAHATEDQASDHTTQSQLNRTEFHLGTLKGNNSKAFMVGCRRSWLTSAADVQEAAPTSDQLTSILEYLGPAQAGNVIADATSTADAIKKFKANDKSFQAPVTVDWMNARAGMFWAAMERANLHCSLWFQKNRGSADTLQSLAITRARS